MCHPRLSTWMVDLHTLQIDVIAPQPLAFDLNNVNNINNNVGRLIIDHCFCFPCISHFRLTSSSAVLSSCLISVNF